MAIIQRGLQFVVATYSGTGANLALDLGFVPMHATAYDVSQGTSGWDWNSAMSVPATPSLGADVYGVTNNAGTFATITRGTGGIVALDGSAGTAIGLTIGTNTVINTAGHGYIVSAWEPN